MIAALIQSQAGEQIKAQYEHLLLGFEGAWSTFAAETPTLLRARALKLQLSSLGQAHMRGILNTMGGALAQAKVLAFKDAGAVNERRHEFEDLFFEEGLSALERAAEHDGRTLIKRAQQVAARYQVAAMRMPPGEARLAALGELPGQQSSAFGQLTRAHRALPSTAYVVLTVSDLMARCYAHAFATALASRGLQHARAVHPVYPAIELDLLGNWSEWSGEHLHANTRWTLEVA
jgi:hypothetical protein